MSAACCPLGVMHAPSATARRKPQLVNRLASPLPVRFLSSVLASATARRPDIFAYEIFRDPQFGFISERSRMTETSPWRTSLHR